MSWFSIIVMLSGFLAEFGTIKLLSAKMAVALSAYPAAIALPIIVLLYFYVHYMFASVTAHTTVLFTTFLFVILSFDVSPRLAGMVLAYFSPLSAGLTHYGSSVAPIFYGNKSLSTKEWWGIGLIISVCNLVIWLGTGSFWWRYLGWY
jgi:DASS family divalent anion:Na+ symporter